MHCPASQPAIYYHYDYYLNVHSFHSFFQSIGDHNNDIDMHLLDSFVKMVYHPTSLMTSEQTTSSTSERRARVTNQNRYEHSSSSSTSYSYSSSSSSSSSSHSNSENALKKRKMKKRPTNYASTSSSSSSLSSSNTSFTESSTSIEYELEETEQDKQRRITHDSMVKIMPYMTQLSKKYSSISLEFLQKVYATFNQIPFNDSERATILCGLSQMISITSRDLFTQQFVIPECKESVIQNQGCTFYNIHYPGKHDDDGDSDLKERCNHEIMLVERWKHNLFSYIITHALIQRLINLSSKKALKMPKDGVTILNETLNRYSFLFHVNNNTNNVCLCGGGGGGGGQKKHHQQSLCMNNFVVYTKRDCKFFTWLENSCSLFGDGDCQVYTPLPFHLVLFLCGKYKAFRSIYNMKEEQSGTQMTEHTSPQMMCYDTYINYEKWVSVPSYYYAIYESLNKSTTFL
jgi:hypothetical protein